MNHPIFDSEDCKVSVLLPVFNGERYLEQALVSILRQQCVDEIVIVDNGSTDQSVTIITGFAAINPKIRLIFCTKRGVANALTYGLGFTKNEFVARIDADDVMEPGRVNRQVERLVENPELGIVASQVTYINENSEVTGVSAYPVGILSLNGNFIFRNPIAHPSVMFRKSIIESVGGYRATFEGAEDLDLWIRVAHRHPVFVEHLALTRYRSHSTQVSNTNNLYISELRLRCHILISNEVWGAKGTVFRLLQMARIFDLASMSIPFLKRLRVRLKEWVRKGS